MLTDILPPAEALLAFLGASIVLAVTPGPGVIYILARSAFQGRRHGLASVAGVALGNFGNALGASLGLATLFALSSVAFTVVKWAGAAYLVYLGIKTILVRDGGSGRLAAPPVQTLWRAGRDGFFVALLNPKTTIFFAAFLPQFMSATSNVAAQSVFLGGLFVLIAAATDTAYAVTAGTASRLVVASRPVRRAGRYLTGGVFIGLGLFTAVAGQRPVR